MDVGLEAFMKMALRRFNAPPVVAKFIAEAKWSWGGCKRDVRVSDQLGIEVRQLFEFEGQRGEFSAALPYSLVTPEMMALIAKQEDKEAAKHHG